MATNAHLAAKEHTALTRVQTAIGKLADRFEIPYVDPPFVRDERFYAASKMESYAAFLEALDAAAVVDPGDDVLVAATSEALTAAIAAAYARYDGDSRVHGPEDADAFNDAVRAAIFVGALEDAAQSGDVAPQATEADDPASESIDAAADDSEGEPELVLEADDDGPADENGDGVIDDAEAKKEAEREKRRARDAARKAKELVAFDSAASEEGP